MKLLDMFASLALVGGLVACATSERPVGRQVMVIAPPADIPDAVAAAPAAAASAPPPVAPAPPVPEPATPAPVATAPAPPPTPLPPAAATPPADVIYFGPDAYKFAPAYRPVLAAHAKKLKASPSLHLMIQAWADRRGASDYNLALSKKRAQTVARFLIGQGVAADQLELVYHGERHEPDVHGQRVAAAADRRVELQYRLP